VDAIAATAGPTTLQISGVSLTSCSLSGTGFALGTVTVVAPWQPVPAQGIVRFVDAALPARPGDRAHFVEVIADEDVDLARWRLQWRPADASTDWRNYHTFAAAGRRLEAGETARISGGLPAGYPVPGRRTWFGGTDGIVPPTGALWRLCDSSGRVVHERAEMSTDSTMSCSVLPNDDLTRAYIEPAGRLAGTAPRWWALTMTFARDVGPGDPVLSVAGDTAPETVTIAFPVR
jgi:hypothetical protein